MNKRLNAPPGYHWTDEEVLYEKNESLLTGIIIGMLIGLVIIFVIIGLVG